jgi:myo-inositol-1(or 4)-monophosphatase
MSDELFAKFSFFVDEIGKYLFKDLIVEELVVETKQDGSYVSNWDLNIQSFVSEKVHSNFPDFQLISEEGVLQFNSLGNYIVLDPIDGTENFVSGIPIWGVGVAFFVNSKLEASAVFFPEIGMYKYSKLLKVSQPFFREFRKTSHKSRVVGFSSNSNWTAVLDNFGLENRVLGCALFNLTLAVNGSIDFIGSDSGSMVWDIAPGLLFALENNQTVFVNEREYFGEFLDPSQRHTFRIVS